MDVMRIHIDELVLDGFAPNAPELNAAVAQRVSAALVERGLAPNTAARVSDSVGVEVAQRVTK